MRYDNDIETDLTARYQAPERRNPGVRTASRGSARNRKPVKSNGKNGKTTTRFKRLLKVYIAFLCVLSFMFLVYVMNTLYQYEASFPDNYMSSVTKDIAKKGKSGKISKLCNTKTIEINNLDNSGKNANKIIKGIFKKSNVTYKKNDGMKNSQNPVYSIYANDKKIMEVKLRVKSQKKRLGLFTYPVWEVEEYKLGSDRGIEYFDIQVPSNYTVEVNGTKLDDKYITSRKASEEYEKFKEYVELPELVNYELNHFIQTPSIVIKDEKGNTVESTIKGNKVEVANASKTADSYEEAKKSLKGEIDILKLAKNWSLFLTDDLDGGQHGFATLKPYLTKKSSFYDMAYAWATSIDITFVSSHKLKDPAFTNTSVKDFVIYSDKAFSCTVHLEKNMKIANGNDKVDVMNDRLYFVYYDDTDDGVDNPSWKLIDMKSVVDK